MPNLSKPGVSLALWVIAANLTFLSLSSLVGTATAQGPQDDLQRAMTCGPGGRNRTQVCWIRAETVAAGAEFSS